MTIIVPICGTSTRFSKVRLYELGYICTLLELPFHSESIANSVIFNFKHLRSRKLWPYNVILIAIGMHTNPYIASLAIIACNWELLCKADLILMLKKAFSA